MSTRLYDMLFSTSPASMTSGDRTHARPRYVKWRRVTLNPGDTVSWHTDGQSAFESEAGTRVKWLLEPRANHPENFTEEALRGFDVVYTHDPEILAHDSRARFYPLGGTRIHESDWGRVSIDPQLPISIVASPKRGLLGHMMRHAVIAACPDLGAFGPDYQPIREKYDALAGSRFHVAIEPVRSPFYVSEHLIDAMLTMNVPIYYGASEEVLSGLGFDVRGIIFVDSAEDTIDVVRVLSTLAERERAWDYRRRSIDHNFRIACRYTCPEDWLYLHDPSLFEAAS